MAKQALVTACLLACILAVQSQTAGELSRGPCVRCTSHNWLAQLRCLQPCIVLLHLLDSIVLADMEPVAGTCSTVNRTAGVCADRPPAGTYQCAPDSSLCCLSSVTGFNCPVCGAVYFRK